MTQRNPTSHHDSQKDRCCWSRPCPQPMANELFARSRVLYSARARGSKQRYEPWLGTARRPQASLHLYGSACNTTAAARTSAQGIADSSRQHPDLRTHVSQAQASKGGKDLRIAPATAGDQHVPNSRSSSSERDLTRVRIILSSRRICTQYPILCGVFHTCPYALHVV